MFLCGKTTPPLKFQKFPKLSQSVFQNLKQDKCSVAVFSLRENPSPSIFALANPSTQTKKIRFISAPLSGPVSSAFQKLEARYVFSRSFQSQRKSVTIYLRFSEPFNANKENPFHQRSAKRTRFIRVPKT